MDSSRLKRAMGQELYWVFHFFIAVGTTVGLVWKTPLPLVPACAAGVATFGLLFAAHLWTPTAIAALALVGVAFTATFAGIGAALAMKAGFDQGPAMVVCAVLGAGLGGWFAVVEGREQLRAAPSDDA